MYACVNVQGTYGQVVLTSLKMRPMPALELLSKVSGSPADAPAAVKAAAWQDNLKLALEAAAALEANASVTQMHTRMTSILNMVRAAGTVDSSLIVCCLCMCSFSSGMVWWGKERTTFGTVDSSWLHLLLAQFIHHFLQCSASAPKRALVSLLMKQAASASVYELRQFPCGMYPAQSTPLYCYPLHCIISAVPHCTASHCAVVTVPPVSSPCRASS